MMFLDSHCLFLENKSVPFFAQGKMLDLCSITVIMEEGTPSFHGVENLAMY
jgi:hypothetical protein